MGYHVTSKPVMFFSRMTMIIMVILLVKVESYKPRKHHNQVQERPMNLAKTESNKCDSSTTETVSIQDRLSFIAMTRASSQISDLLSSDIFSETNPIQYLIRKSSKLLMSYDFSELITELKSRLKNNQFSERYTPYARLLLSIVRAEMALYNLKLNIQGIQTNYEIFHVPTEILNTPELSASGLFSSDVFSDPDPPTQLLEKLMQIPKNNVPELNVALKKFTKLPKNWKTTPIERQTCVWYIRKLVLFFKKESSVLDDLARDEAEIQHTHSIDSYQSFDDIRPNNSPNYQPTMLSAQVC